MTLTNPVNVVSSIGNGVTTIWPYSFLIPSGTVEVTLTTIATGVESAVLPSSDYTIAGEDDENGGTVTYPLSGSPIASTVKINIKRVVEIEQTLDLTKQSAFFPDSLEAQLDLIVMMISQQQEEIDRSIKTATGTSGEEADLIASIAAAVTAAQAASVSAVAAFDSFDDKYLGAFAVAPTLDNDGAALVTGALYYDTVAAAMKVWSGAAWLAAYVGAGAYAAIANNLSDLASGATAFKNIMGTAATIASAATVDLSVPAVMTGFNGLISGSVGISAFTLSAQQVSIVRFTGAPLITVGANLVGNNNGNNIQIEADDFAIIRRTSTSVVYFTHIPVRHREPLVPKGAAIASAATITIGEGRYFHVTGVTGISDIDFTTPTDGKWAILEFDGILILTNGANMKLPGAANITTAAGDIMIPIQDVGDAVRCLYFRADGSAVGAAASVTLAHGTYTPTLFNTTNISSSTAFACQYMRVGNTVTVSGKFTMDPNAAATPTELGMSLPIASALATEQQLAGMSTRSDGGGDTGPILANTTNDRAKFVWGGPSINSEDYVFSFTYLVV